MDIIQNNSDDPRMNFRILYYNLYIYFKRFILD
nr:MAG TPA: hypothetical protein [Caudoviricetes sp.]